MYIFGISCVLSVLFSFFFNDTATTEIYTLSLHDALPISPCHAPSSPPWPRPLLPRRDRKSTRLNSSHVAISYAVFCLKKKRDRDLVPPAINDELEQIDPQRLARRR